MRYFVIADDGGQYGPADLATLNAWIAEGRVLPHTLLQQEGTHLRIAASAVAGLQFPSASPPSYGSPNPGYAGYYRGTGSPADNGSKELTYAWVGFGIAVVGFGLCPCISVIAGGVGVHFGNQAKKIGHPQGGLAWGLSLAAAIIGVLGIVFSFVMGLGMAASMRGLGG